MSHRTLPLLYLNLAGEMMYIIDDRLMYQKIPSERAVKGMNFLTLLICNMYLLGFIYPFGYLEF